MADGADGAGGAGRGGTDVASGAGRAGADGAGGAGRGGAGGGGRPWTLRVGRGGAVVAEPPTGSDAEEAVLPTDLVLPGGPSTPGAVGGQQCLNVYIGVGKSDMPVEAGVGWPGAIFGKEGMNMRAMGAAYAAWPTEDDGDRPRPLPTPPLVGGHHLGPAVPTGTAQYAAVALAVRELTLMGAKRITLHMTSKAMIRRMPVCTNPLRSGMGPVPLIQRAITGHLWGPWQ